MMYSFGVKTEERIPGSQVEMGFGIRNIAISYLCGAGNICPGNKAHDERFDFLGRMESRTTTTTVGETVTQFCLRQKFYTLENMKDPLLVTMLPPLGTKLVCSLEDISPDAIGGMAIFEIMMACFRDRLIVCKELSDFGYMFKSEGREQMNRIRRLGISGPLCNRNLKEELLNGASVADFVRETLVFICFGSVKVNK